jgi:RHS repeat-associated protein
MNVVTASLRKFLLSGLYLVIACLLLISGFALSIFAQTSSTDGTTPSVLTAGAPAGSSPLSGFDNINLFNGNLNFHLPLVPVIGRGAAQYTMMLPIEEHWRVLDRSTDYQEIWLPTDYTWYDDKPGYGPGVLLGRSAATSNTGSGAPCVPYSPGNTYWSLTRFTFIAPDGTEYEFRDQVTGGQQKLSQCSGNGFNRGTVFVTADGTAATFISDTAVYDQPGTYTQYPYGYLMFRNGLRYRIHNGRVSWMRDPNGNKLSFDYGQYGVTAITDSLNRQITISYADFQTVFFDQINFKGFAGASRSIRVNYSALHNVLRTNRPGDLSTVQTLHALFPELTGSSSTFNDPYKVSSVVLPDGIQQFQFLYNVYGELARVVLPTGGLFEYDFAAGWPNENVDGVYGIPEPQIYRRVSTKRIYKDINTLESKTAFTENVDISSNFSVGTVDNFDASGVLLTRHKHYFYGGPTSGSSAGGSPPFNYPAWNDGKEYQTEVIDTANCVPASCATVLRRTVNTWEQGVAVSAWSNTIPNNPRLQETTVSLLDVSPNLVSKRHFGYDDSVPFNNQNNIKEYGFGNGVPGALLRETRTTYVTNSTYTSTSVHIRNLPTQVSVYDAGGVERARSTIEYDNYVLDGADCLHSFHCPLQARSNISGFDSLFGTSYTTRGNATSSTRYLLTNGAVTGSVSSYSHYDVAGNVIRSLDPRSTSSNYIETTIEYDDRFGAPDNEARANSVPTELTGFSSFAFPTKVTNALGHTTYAQFDYYLGKPVNGEDANGVVASGAFNDLLDRPTQIRHAIGTTVENQTTFAYDNANHIITSSSDRDAYNDNVLVSKVVYDQIGRTIETRQYEGGDNYIVTETQYDALSRPYKSSNPYRRWQSETAVWTTQAFDALGRVISVTTPDNAVVSTSYSGNSVTVTDQAGKARKSVIDALGHLSDVYEDPSGVGYQTTYMYDVLDNLVKVTQGSQQRFFMYDSLKRLIRAHTPEQDALAALSLFDPITNHSNWSSSYQYDSNSNLTSKTDARGVVTDNVYDALNRVTTSLYRINGQPDPNTGDVEFLYDNATYGKGRLWLTYRWGAKPSHTAVGFYDALGRVKQFYNLFGDGQGGWSAGYEVDRTYNLAGNVISQTYPSGRTVSYSYDSADRTTSFTGNLGDGTQRTYATSIQYSPFGGIKKEQFGTQQPLYHHQAYNIRGQVYYIAMGPNNDDWGGNYGKLIYYYGNPYCFGCSGAENNGNIRLIDYYLPDGYLTHDHYDYDSLNRLLDHIEEDTAQQFRQYYSYDRYGNRTIDQTISWGNINKTPFTVTEANNRLGVPAGQSGSMNYDAAGNLTNDTYTGAGFRTYDAENRIVSAWGGNNQAQYYTYNAAGQRVRRKIDGVESWQIYGIDGELVAEYAANATTTSPQKEYGYRNGELLITAEAGPKIQWLVADHLGTPRMLFDQTGSLANVKRHDYLPFGEELLAGAGGRTAGLGYASGDGVREQFTAKERDIETGLDYFGSRYYAGMQGRFTSVDPHDINLERQNTPNPEEANALFRNYISQPQHWNSYAYALNNPLRYVDPDGLMEYETVLLGQKIKVHIDDSIIKNDPDALKRIQGNLQKAFDKINSGAASLSEEQIESIHSQNRIYVSNDNPIGTFGGTFYISQKMAENPNIDKLAADIVHDSRHSEQLARGLSYNETNAIPMEREASLFTVGVINNIGGWNTDVVEGYEVDAITGHVPSGMKDKSTRESLAKVFEKMNKPQKHRK